MHAGDYRYSLFRYPSQSACWTNCTGYQFSIEVIAVIIGGCCFARQSYLFRLAMYPLPILMLIPGAISSITIFSSTDVTLP